MEWTENFWLAKIKKSVLVKTITMTYSSVQIVWKPFDFCPDIL